MPKALHRIVTIGGGSGQFTLLSGLRALKGLQITAVVSMVDSGGSTGRLRDELGILPPGDVLKCILALSPHSDFARTIFLKRFQDHRRLRGHNAGNMLLTMLGQYTGSFPGNPGLVRNPRCARPDPAGDHGPGHSCGRTDRRHPHLR